MDIKKKAAILARRSKKRRDRADGIKYQIDAVIEYAKQHGYTVEKCNIYEDDNRSGTSAKKRDGLKNLLRDAESGMFQYVLVWKLDRLARDLELSLELRKKLTQCGIKIISVTEWVNDDTVTAKEMTYMANVQAEIYIDRLRENVNRGLDGVAKRNFSTGGVAALGYDIVKKQFVINEFEAEAVRTAYAMYANGFSKIIICKHLNDAGYRTKAGAMFTVTSFDRIFQNKRYIGTYTYDGYNGKVENPNAIPAIVDVETFNRVQERNAVGRIQQNVYHTEQ